MSDEKERLLKKQPRNPTFCKQLKKVIIKVFLIIRYIFDHFIDFVYSFYYKHKKQQLPNSTNPIIVQSATELALKIRRRELKAEEVVQAFIDRIKEVNPILNALVDNCFHDAIKEAQQIDKDIASGTIIDVDFQLKPFLGVPFTTKESTASKGLSHTFGLICRKGKKATFDATVVENMKKAGGILLGVTNVPQLNLWQESSNPLFGITNNPYDNTRNVGGSSGGEASLLAAGGSAFGVGSDIGGSIRLPCFMCGVFGHKPTSDLISTCGLTFRTGKEKDTMVVAGPMTRYAEDLTPMLKVLIGEGEKLNKLQLDKKIDLKKDIKVYYIRNPKDMLISPFREDMKRVFEKTINFFEEILAEKPELVQFKGLEYAGPLWKYWMTQEPNANFNRDIANREGEVKTCWEILKYMTGQSEYTAAVILNLIGGLTPKIKDNWARTLTSELRKNIIDKLGSDGVLIYPSAPWPASYHHTALLRPFNFGLFAIWNVLKLPVTQIPLGLSAEGLPLGVQVVSAPFNDHLGLSVAKLLEKQFGGYVPPFKVNDK